MSQHTSIHHQAHLARAVRLSPRDLRYALAEVKGFNAKLAVLVTHLVGTMACAYGFAALACISLPAVLATGSETVIVAWVAQTFLQLVLLSIILVGQRVQALASDAQAERQYADTEWIADRLNESTPGGITTVLDCIEATAQSIEELQGTVDQLQTTIAARTRKLPKTEAVPPMPRPQAKKRKPSTGAAS